jgi:hypothetical protein
LASVGLCVVNLDEDLLSVGKEVMMASVFKEDSIRKFGGETINIEMEDV